MDAYEKFFFDLNGYLVVEDVLTSEDLAACNEAVDHNPDRIQVRPRERSLAGGSDALKGALGRDDLSGMLSWPKPWCQPFRDLLSHRRIIPYLLEILGDGFRLDHLYGIITRPGAEGHVLHGGDISPAFPHFYRYHNGKMLCGLTVVSWVLTDCGPGDGGFACIPGSHKSNFAVPRDVRSLEKDIGVVRQVEARAGSAIIFTEALIHGALPWKASHDRRAILYKYAPGPLAYSQHHPLHGAEAALDEFTPLQQALLEPAHRRDRPHISVD